MINYAEKGIGLHERIFETGHYLYESNGVWVSDDDAIVQNIIDQYTVQDAINRVNVDIDLKAKKLRDSLLEGISPGEMASWYRKLNEALAYQSTNDPSKAPSLSLEAYFRQSTLPDLVTKVLGKATALEQYEALVAGVNGRHRDAIKNMTTFGEVLSYNWMVGWTGG